MKLPKKPKKLPVRKPKLRPKPKGPKGKKLPIRMPKPSPLARGR